MRETILGIIQGLTEFLPISSSGHLALIQSFYKGLDDSDILLDILLHIGTLLVVCIYYRKDIIAICRAIFSVKPSSSKNEEQDQWLFNRRMLPLIIVGSIPTAIIGLVFKSFIERNLTSLSLVGAALLVTGTILYMADALNISSAKHTISYLDALVIGTVQGIAVFPGISRSGSTISAGIFLGIERKMAAKYSFLLSIPAILGAAMLEVKNLLTLAQTPHLILYILGTIAAFITGYFAIATLIKVVVNHKLSWFSWYCWGLGGLALAYGLIF